MEIYANKLIELKNKIEKIDKIKPNWISGNYISIVNGVAYHYLRGSVVCEIPVPDMEDAFFSVDAMNSFINEYKDTTVPFDGDRNREGVNNVYHTIVDFCINTTVLHGSFVVTKELVEELKKVKKVTDNLSMIYIDGSGSIVVNTKKSFFQLKTKINKISDLNNTIHIGLHAFLMLIKKVKNQATVNIFCRVEALENGKLKDDYLVKLGINDCLFAVGKVVSPVSNFKDSYTDFIKEDEKPNFNILKDSKFLGNIPYEDFKRNLKILKKISPIIKIEGRSILRIAIECKDGFLHSAHTVYKKIKVDYGFDFKVDKGLLDYVTAKKGTNIEVYEKIIGYQRFYLFKIDDSRIEKVDVDLPVPNFWNHIPTSGGEYTSISNKVTLNNQLPKNICPNTTYEVTVSGSSIFINNNLLFANSTTDIKDCRFKIKGEILMKALTPDVFKRNWELSLNSKLVKLYDHNTDNMIILSRDDG